MDVVINRATVWSARIRLTHGLLGLSSILLFVTAWVSGLGVDVSGSARGYHILASYIFSASLLFRIYLLFNGGGSERLSDCLVKTDYSEVIKEHLRFYLSLGKSELSVWYAHNPFWGPVYLAFLFFATIMVLTGFAIGKVYFGPFISLTGIHQFGAGIILIFLVLHIFAVLLHDIKLDTNGISAILSGNKYFQSRPQNDKQAVEFPIKFSPVSPKKNNTDH